VGVRIGVLERKGMLVRDTENSYLQLDAMEDDPMLQLHCHSISYRVAIGSQQGREVFTLQYRGRSQTNLY